MKSTELLRLRVQMKNNADLLLDLEYEVEASPERGPRQRAADRLSEAAFQASRIAAGCDDATELSH